MASSSDVKVRLSWSVSVWEGKLFEKGAVPVPLKLICALVEQAEKQRVTKEPDDLERQNIDLWESLQKIWNAIQPRFREWKLSKEHEFTLTERPPWDDNFAGVVATAYRATSYETPETYTNKGAAVKEVTSVKVRFHVGLMFDDK